MRASMRCCSAPVSAAAPAAAAAAVGTSRPCWAHVTRRAMLPGCSMRGPASCTAAPSSKAPAATALSTLPHTSHSPQWTGLKRSSIRTAAASDDSSASNPGDDAPKTVALVRQFPGVGYTFILAGFLKILTMASLTSSAPVGAVRSALGQNSQFLLVPGGLMMCWIAKQVVDRDLQESPKFMAGLVGVLVFMYFLIYKLLYRYDIVLENVSRPRPVSNSNLAQVRAGAGDRDLSGLVLRDSRSYDEVKGQKGQYNDLAYYEGRYPSQMQEAEKAARASSTAAGQDAGGTAGAARPTSAELDARNPLRQAYRRAPGSTSAAEQQERDAIMRPR